MQTYLQKSIVTLALFASLQRAPAQGTAFTYQGQLASGGIPANGNYTMSFALWSAATNGAQIAGPLTVDGIAAANGLFTATLDFGPGIFAGSNYWLQISVATNGGSLSPLTPLQPLTPAPYAIFANTASNLLGALPASQLTGAFPSQLTGALPDTQLSANVALRAGGNTFTGTQVVNGNLGINTASTPENDFSINSDTYLFSHAILLRGETGADHNHGLAYCGPGFTNFATGVLPDGPVLWGFGGGALGVKSGGAQAVLTWANGGVSVNGGLTVNGEFMTVNGLSGLRCYLGDDGSGNDVQVGSLKSGVTAVSMYNATDKAYMHLYCSSITVEGGADLAEPFQIAAPGMDIVQGAVVVIDEKNPGHLKLSDRPYDTRVAGVVSGANGIHPGIQLQQQGLLEGGRNVALTGRVYAQADASNGAIHPGDLLTTSGTPGYAMKAADHAKAPGAILGKAMSGLLEGRGMVLVLVTLQ